MSLDACDESGRVPSSENLVLTLRVLIWKFSFKGWPGRVARGAGRRPMIDVCAPAGAGPARDERLATSAAGPYFIWEFIQKNRKIATNLSVAVLRARLPVSIFRQAANSILVHISSKSYLRFSCVSGRGGQTALMSTIYQAPNLSVASVLFVLEIEHE
ncbi:hypothetical protein EVAR_90397_1 [Eumeta japonica]|uniref:Uncharacterized protein n=1 Tax=Eumeta variegata TaxID=151549 RepID=A0A4C1ZVG1_EUMVA|nr:hypothetical protein EVAR_90397_1 [Eumeta japonica]